MNGHVFYSDDAASRCINSRIGVHSRDLQVAYWITCECNAVSFWSMSVGRPEDELTLFTHIVTYQHQIREP